MDDLQEILARLRESPRDQHAWRRFFQATWPFVLALSHRSLPGSERAFDADDLAQEVYLKFARYWHSRVTAIRDEHTLFPLLAVITRSTAQDYNRFRSRRRRDSSREAPMEAGEPANRRDGFTDVDFRDLLDVVSSRLSPDERLALNLRLQGFQVREIAERCRTSPSTIERRLRRIREVVGPSLLQELDEELGGD